MTDTETSRFAAQTPALVVVDVQKGFNEPSWGPRNNPACEQNIAALVGFWDRAALPLVYVRHDSAEPGSPLAAGTGGNDFQSFLTAEPSVVIAKRVNSAFHGTPSLERWLRDEGLSSIVICGITTNHCCETTARVGANLDFDVTFVLDATYTFARTGLDGEVISADELARVTAANLQDEFASVQRTHDTLDALGTTAAR